LDAAVVVAVCSVRTSSRVTFIAAVATACKTVAIVDVKSPIAPFSVPTCSVDGLLEEKAVVIGMRVESILDVLL
jgi:hypothetical protein